MTRHNVSPYGRSSSSLLDDESISISCLTLCAAIQCLVGLVRCAILHSLATKNTNAHTLTEPFLGPLFHGLLQILRHHGMPPCGAYNHSSTSQTDRTAARRSQRCIYFAFATPVLAWIYATLIQLAYIALLELYVMTKAEYETLACLNCPVC